MDRLPAVRSTLVALVVCVGCNEKPKGDPAAFCARLYAGETGPTLTYPAVVDGSLPAASGRPRWVNPWATWCKPCVEEIPRLIAWRDKLASAGRPFDLVFISADEDGADVAEFRKQQPQAPATRLAAPQEMGAWYASTGLDAAATLPIHIFVTAAGHVRCVRAGAVRERDYAVVEQLLAP